MFNDPRALESEAEFFLMDPVLLISNKKTCSLCTVELYKHKREVHREVRGVRSNS